MRRLAPAVLAGAILVADAPASDAEALVFDLPDGAIPTGEDRRGTDGITIPVGPWKDGGSARLAAEGDVSRQAWRLPGTSLTPFEILAPLRAALEEAGYEILYACSDTECGGFDFRYDLDLLPAPAMHVDLGDFRYLAARSGTGGADGTADVVSLVASRSLDAGFLHVLRVGAPVRAAPPPPARETAPEPPPDVDTRGVIERLETEGHAILEDLRFPPGTAALEERFFPSLAELADWLNGRPEIAVLLVGHSDAAGALSGNIDLSRRRAEAVRARLLSAHGVAGGQIAAEGVGYLAPLASNDTEEGRARNRRVEVIRMPDG